MHYDALWCIMMHYDALRCIMMHYDALRGHTRPHEDSMMHRVRHHPWWFFFLFFSFFFFLFFFFFLSNQWKYSRNASLLRSNLNVFWCDTVEFDLRSDALRVHFHLFEQKTKNKKTEKIIMNGTVVWCLPGGLIWPHMASYGLIWPRNAS